MYESDFMVRCPIKAAPDFRIFIYLLNFVMFYAPSESGYGIYCPESGKPDYLSLLGLVTGCSMALRLKYLAGS